MPQLFPEAGEQATALDDLIESVVDDADFMEGYFAARRINDRRDSKSQPETTPAPQQANGLSIA